MSDSPQDLYAKCLPSHRGYPLWSPEPSNTLPASYTQDGLQIGDVGFVDGKGRFNVLFNICFGPEHALHRRFNVTFSSNPIPLDCGEINIMPNADPPGCIITSAGVTQPDDPSANHYVFTPSPAKGAILILPDGATSHDISASPTNERFRKVATEHAFDWYEIAKERCGESIKNDSLYLITGFYKTRSWFLASFHDEAIATEPRRIRVVTREDQRAAAGRAWFCTFPVHSRDGPGPGHKGYVNQTVFISGFKITIREDVLGWLLQKPEVKQVPAIRQRKACCFVKFLRVLRNKSKHHRMPSGRVEINQVPMLSQPFHPSDCINQYMLNKDPRALVAVTHDSEWMALIEAGKFTSEELTQKDLLETFLSKNYLLISEPENGVVYLQSKSRDQKMGIKSEVSWHTGPSADNLRVAITRIRAADITSGFKRMPVGFYIVVQFDGIKRRTGNKPVRLHDTIVEWDDKIWLPSEPSAKVHISLCASFEFSPVLGNGEVLRTVNIRAEDLLDSSRVVTFPSAEGELASPCSSLHITTEQSPSHKLVVTSNKDEDFDWEESSDLALLTDRGHTTLLRYRVDSREEIILAAVGHFEQALAACLPDHHCYAAVLSNLAGAHFINSRVSRRFMDVSTSILHYREALKLRPIGHLDRPTTLLHLAEVLLYHYGKLGFEEYPGEITELASEVYKICPADSHEHRAADLTRQTYTLYTTINSCSSTNIDKLIPGLRRAVEDVPRDYFDRRQRLSNHVLALWTCYEICWSPRYLDESITTHEAIMRTAICDLDSRIHAQLLVEKDKGTLTGSSWRDALVTADSLVVPKGLIYQVLCERLEGRDYVLDATECFHEMKIELADAIRGGGEAKWIPGFKSRCCGKLEGLGDIAMNSSRYDEAISLYSVALSLDPVASQGLFIKRSKAYIGKGLLEEALNDANKAIVLDPSSPWAHERRYVALRKAGDYDGAEDALQVVLSTMEEVPESEIPDHYRCYIPRIRILCVGRVGVGKSSLINRVLGITEAKLSEYAPGEASIDQEFVSDENKYFVLHDSNGFELGNNTNFTLADRFLRERHHKKLLKDRLHVIWLCTETPRGGGRVLEEGDKKLLALAHELGTPVVVVFTKYDMLVWSKQLELEDEEEEDMDKVILREKSQMNASNTFAATVQSLDKSAAVLKIPTPPYVNISVSRGYEQSIVNLVDTTRKICDEQFKSGPWVATALGPSPSVKIRACVDSGFNFYYHAPGAENTPQQWLAQVHHDIVTYWDFRDENKALGETEFKQLMLYLVQDLCPQSPSTIPALDEIGRSTNLITAGTVSLSSSYLEWISDTALQHTPQVECLFMAYIIDLISILFDSTFNPKPHLVGATGWEVVKEAVENYARSNKRREIHDSCRLLYESNQVLTQESFRQAIKKLLGDHWPRQLGDLL